MRRMRRFRAACGCQLGSKLLNTMVQTREMELSAVQVEVELEGVGEGLATWYLTITRGDGTMASSCSFNNQ